MSDHRISTAGSIVVLALLVGCTATRAGIPATYVGTWVEVEGSSRASVRLVGAKRSGFVAIGNDQVVINLAGQERRIGKPLEVALEAGIGGGRMTLDNGLRLYLASGRGIAAHTVDGERVAGVANFLDVDVYQVASETGREQLLLKTRLWSEPHLPMAADAALVAAGGSRVTPTASAPPAASPTPWPRLPADARFLAALTAGGPSPFVRVAEELVRQAEAGAGAEACAKIAWRQTATARAGILAILAAARSGDGDSAPALLAEAQRDQRWLAAFTEAFSRWRATRT